MSQQQWYPITIFCWNIRAILQYSTWAYNRTISISIEITKVFLLYLLHHKWLHYQETTWQRQSFYIDLFGKVDLFTPKLFGYSGRGLISLTPNLFWSSGRGLTLYTHLVGCSGRGLIFHTQFTPDCIDLFYVRLIIYHLRIDCYVYKIHDTPNINDVFAISTILRCVKSRGRHGTRPQRLKCSRFHAVFWNGASPDPYRESTSQDPRYNKHTYKMMKMLYWHLQNEVKAEVLLKNIGPTQSIINSSSLL